MSKWDEDYWDQEYYDQHVKNEPVTKHHGDFVSILIYLCFLIPGIFLMAACPPLGAGLIVLGARITNI